jgi:hypothetical protein
VDEAPGVLHPAHSSIHTPEMQGSLPPLAGHLPISYRILLHNFSRLSPNYRQINMKTYIAFSLMVLAVFTAIAQERGQQSTLSGVIPTPRQMIAAPEPFKPTARTRIVLGERTTAEDKFAAEQINVRLTEMQKDPLSTIKEDALKKIPKGSIFVG